MENITITLNCRKHPYVSIMTQSGNTIRLSVAWKNCTHSAFSEKQFKKHLQLIYPFIKYNRSDNHSRINARFMPRHVNYINYQSIIFFHYSFCVKKHLSGRFLSPSRYTKTNKIFQPVDYHRIIGVS